MEIKKNKKIESLLQTTTYDEMTLEQKALVSEYETEQLKPRVDELKKSLPVSEIENQIHNWWLDYQIADETEEKLLTYVKG